MSQRPISFVVALALTATPVAAHSTHAAHSHTPWESWLLVAVVLAIPALISLWDARKSRAKR